MSIRKAFLLKLFERGEVLSRDIQVEERFDFSAMSRRGIVVEVRQGRIYVTKVKDPEAMRSYILARHPLAFEDLALAPPKSRAVGERHDAHTNRGSVGEAVLVLAVTPGVRLRSGMSELDLFKESEAWGSVSFTLMSGREWPSLIGPTNGSGLVVLSVENSENMLVWGDNHSEGWRHCKAPGCDLILMTSGNPSNRLIEWLSKQDVTVLHAGDYDPVGLKNFSRLRKAMPGRVELFVPDNLEELWKVGKKKALAGSSNQALLEKLRNDQSLGADCNRVLGLILESGKGLEQEALILDQYMTSHRVPLSND